MSSAVKISHIVSSRYALAFIDLAEGQNAVSAVEKDLLNITAVLSESPELARLVESPATTRAKAEKMVRLLASQIGAHKLTGNFLGVLVKNRRLPALRAVIQAAQEELRKRRGETTVEIKTAQDLTPEQTQSLQRILSDNLGRKVAVKAFVEPGILGGMIVTVGSHMIDDSVARKLERLQIALEGQANQNINTKIAREA